MKNKAKTEFVSGGVLSSPSPSFRPPPPPSFRPPPPPMSPPAILPTHDDLKDKDDSDDDGEKIEEKAGPEKSAKEIAACAEEAKEKEEEEKEEEKEKEKEKEKKEKEKEKEKKEEKEEEETSDEEESEWEWTEEEEEEEGEEWEAKEESWQNILSTAKGPTTFKAEFSIKIPVK
jgi:hypothetical protein